jgi:hypothetical protein
MSQARLPVHYDLRQLKVQAKELLRAVHRADPEALAELREHHPSPPPPESAKLADAQLVLARHYGAPSWPRLVHSCEMLDAIWADDVETIRSLVMRHPNLLDEDAGIGNVNWGPPLSYAANVGRNRIIEVLHELGARDLEYALGRAVLQSRMETAHLLHRLLGSPRPPADALGSPAYTLSVSGTEFLFSIGGAVCDANGLSSAPVDIVIESDSRKPAAKHRILELYAEHGFEFPDTPTMALHRGRIDLLERHLRQDSELLTRTFSFSDIYPPELHCQPAKLGGYDENLPRTPIANSTLLHMAVEYDELDIARWLLAHGADPNARAAVDPYGFGGHSALFNAVVSYPIFWMNFTGGWPGTRKPENADFAELLLERGADPNQRASFRRVLARDGKVELRDHRDVTPLAWGDAFPEKIVVSEPAKRAIEAAGGHR